MLGGIALASLAFLALENLKQNCKDSLELHAWRFQMEAEERGRLQRKVNELEAIRKAEKLAIESNSLPWYAKNDKLEARFEADALDKLDNPQVDYQDVVAGLGGTN